MASEQMRRENVTDERKIDVEKDRVPKMATHFESLASDQKDDVALHGEKKAHGECVPVRAGKEREEARIGKEETREAHGPSLQEISNLRATAQQNSMEAIRAAEERYNKAKEIGILQEGKDVISSKGGEMMKDTTMEGKDVISSKGGALMGTTMEKGQQAKDYTAQKAMEAKDVISSKAGALKDTTMETGAGAKDVITSKGGALMEKTRQAKDYTAQKAVEAKDKIVDTTVSAAGYVGEKAVAAKDATVESGKRVVPEVKDKAVVAGWGAAHYTLEKVAEATKAVANVTSSVAGYAKDTVVSTEEKAAEYAARKQAEAKEGLEVKKSAYEKGEVGGVGETLVSKEQHETREKAEILPSEKTKPSFQGEEKHEKGEAGVEQKGQGGGVFHAIGETIVEIGQTTGELLVGHRDETRGNEETYTGTGEGI